MNRIPTFIALLSLLLLSPLAHADNHAKHNPKMLDESKDKMMDKQQQLMKENKDRVKKNKGKNDLDYHCSEQGQQHGKCDELKDKMKDKQHNKQEMMKDKRPDKSKGMKDKYNKENS
ncbi:hypothetical protein H2O73_03230 [Vibrio sp. 404]|uniref:Pentapeptide MXKDX repeat protein n=1 Tax=Vibrio marinisediminis TaxID=2758441 RepID=A0A7W2ISC8_9VIBR|nr:hypothetical protein [Vibrio marinisediminis]MBA5761346.1 hypothetical protein [Vibrio marinisediminis]